MDSLAATTAVDEEEPLSSELLSMRKSQFRVSIRHQKMRELLQQKRSKISSTAFTTNTPSENSQTTITNPTTAINFEFDFNILSELAQEFQATSRREFRIHELLMLIRYEIEVNPQPLADRILSTPLLFMSIINIIASSNYNQMEKIVDTCYDIAINISFSCVISSELNASICDVLLGYSTSGIRIDDAKNSKILYSSNNQNFSGTSELNTKHYMRSIFEEHMESASFLEIRASSVKFLSNLVIDADGDIIKRILSKGMLFMIMRDNLLQTTYTAGMLESYVDLISNLARHDSWYSYSDFADLPPLLVALLPLLKYDNSLPLLGQVLIALKTILECGDDDDIHQFVNQHHQIITFLCMFLLQTAQQCSESIQSIQSTIMEIFIILLSQFESLTLQVVELGIFDSIGMILASFPRLGSSMLSESSVELLGLTLDVLSEAFGKKCNKITDRFVFDSILSADSPILKRLLTMAAGEDGYAHVDIRNSALTCVSRLVGSSSQEHFDKYFSDEIMRVLLNGLQAISSKPEVVQEILIGLINLIFIGNINSDEQTNNPYTRSFFSHSGDQILDQINERNSDLNADSQAADKAFKYSERLLELILKGNDGEYDDNESSNNNNYFDSAF